MLCLQNTHEATEGLRLMYWPEDCAQTWASSSCERSDRSENPRICYSMAYLPRNCRRSGCTHYESLMIQLFTEAECYDKKSSNGSNSAAGGSSLCGPGEQGGIMIKTQINNMTWNLITTPRVRNQDVREGLPFRLPLTIASTHKQSAGSAQV
jgi:hypothetical protein